MPNYLVRCSGCKEDHSVGTAQAGERLTCSCGAAIEVPTLRGLRELPKDEQDGAKRTSAVSWSSLQGVLFTIGAIAAILAGGTAGVVAVMRSGLPDIPTPAQTKLDDDPIDRMSPAEMLGQWRQLESEGLGPYQPAPHLVVQQMYQRLSMVLTGALWVIGAAVLMMASSLVFRSK